MKDRTIHYGSNEGRWYAATSEAPFFCFEASTEREVQRLAKAALAFYEAFGFKGHNAAKPKAVVRLQNRVLASEIAA